MAFNFNFDDFKRRAAGWLQNEINIQPASQMNRLQSNQNNPQAINMPAARPN